MTRLGIRHLAVVLSLGAGPALAQTVAASGGLSPGNPGTASTASQSLSTTQTVRNHNQTPAFHVLGIPVVIQAPVDAPYSSADAFTTYEGQPGQGPNALLAASNAGTP